MAGGGRARAGGLQRQEGLALLSCRMVLRSLDTASAAEVRDLVCVAHSHVPGRMPGT